MAYRPPALGPQSGSSPSCGPVRRRTELRAALPHVAVFAHTLVDERTGREREVATMECPDWVSTVAVTADGQWVFVRQHRHGIDAPTLEVPGGIVDPGEEPVRAAVRELREETGFTGGDLAPLGFCHPNPALQNNRHHMFLIQGVAYGQGQDLDEGEQCEVVLLDRGRVEEAMANGEVSHALALVALSRAFAKLPAQSASPCSERLAATLDEMRELQGRKVIELARRLRPDLTLEDIRNPHDFPELADPDWHFEDGQLAGIESVAMALRAAGLVKG